MTVAIEQFRRDFPEFSDTTKYPNPAINLYLGLAYKLLVPDRLSDMLDYGAELFTAHNLALEGRNLKTALAGGDPGMFLGIVSSKSVGGLSISYDNGQAMEPGAGHWGLTIYGRIYYSLVRKAGMGGYQSAPSPSPSPSYPWTQGYGDRDG